MERTIQYVGIGASIISIIKVSDDSTITKLLATVDSESMMPID